MDRKILYKSPALEISVTLQNFDTRDFISVTSETPYTSAFAIGREMKQYASAELKRKISMYSGSDRLKRSHKLFDNTKRLEKQNVFTRNKTNYLTRYLESLRGFANGAGIQLSDAVFLQSLGDLACQTIVAKNTDTHSTNVIHIEENQTDDELVKLNTLLDTSRKTKSYEDIWHIHKEFIRKNYHYKIIELKTKHNRALYFAYPGLCTAGPSYGINLTSQILFLTDTLIPKTTEGDFDTWANAIVSMCFDAATLDDVKFILSRISCHRLAILGGYALHVLPLRASDEAFSFEFLHTSTSLSRYKKHGSIQTIAQTNYSLNASTRKHDAYELPKDEYTSRISRIVKSRTGELTTIAQNLVPASDISQNLQSCMSLIASPYGKVESFDNVPVFFGFPTLYEAAYMVGSVDSSSASFIFGKLTPPPIKGNHYTLVSDHPEDKDALDKHDDTQTIAVVYSLPTARLLKTPYALTDEDTSLVAGKVSEALRARGLKTFLVPVDENGITSLRNIRADCIFNLIEWTGLDIDLSKKAFLEFRKLNIPVTGATWENFRDTSDKIPMKKALEKFDFPTPRWQVFKTGSEEVTQTLRLPAIVKPAREHCSIGLTHASIAHSVRELRAIAQKQIQLLSQPVIAEEFIDGRELEVYLLERGKSVLVLPIEEIVFTGHRALQFQTYASKWDKKHPDYDSSHVTRAVLSKKEKNTIEKLCKKAFALLHFRGYARFDIRLRDGIPYVLETNSNPNVYDSEEDQIPGLPFPDFVHAIVESAFYHYQKGWKI